MKILVLGCSGYIGSRILDALKATSWAFPVGASRRRDKAGLTGVEFIQVNTLDVTGLTAALRGFDAVVNCVAGDERSISEGARVLVTSALAAKCLRIIHFSTMSVYGRAEGLVTEGMTQDSSLGWYGRAKCEAETHMQEFTRKGGAVVVLRPGCVCGSGSELWVGRVGRWLQAGRLGDLGIAGDGWSNLVHVDDVCRAALSSLQIFAKSGQLQMFNLSAPDSPRWNDYFVDFALQVKTTPVKRIGWRQLQFDAFVMSPMLKIAQIGLKNINLTNHFLPDPMSPGLTRLWAQHIRLDSTAATQKLEVDWTPYSASLKSSANWFIKNARLNLPVQDKPAGVH